MEEYTVISKSYNDLILSHGSYSNIDEAIGVAYSWLVKCNDERDKIGSVFLTLPEPMKKDPESLIIRLMVKTPDDETYNVYEEVWILPHTIKS